MAPALRNPLKRSAAISFFPLAFLLAPTSASLVLFILGLGGSIILELLGGGTACAPGIALREEEDVIPETKGLLAKLGIKPSARSFIPLACPAIDFRVFWYCCFAVGFLAGSVRTNLPFWIVKEGVLAFALPLNCLWTSCFVIGNRFRFLAITPGFSPL